MNKTIKNALILMTITLVSGLLLGAVYEITKEPRRKQQEKVQELAYQTVFSEADKFENFDYDESKVNESLGKNEITSKNVIIDSAVKALDTNNTLLGYVINVTSKEGFGGDISFSVGIDLNSKITGISILSISETAGLGMNATKEEFLNQYLVDKNGLFIVNKDNNSEGTNIDALSGATITSKAVTKGVNAAVIVATTIMETEKQEVTE
ncbi:MAG: FMN-binding protein [Lachnospiraceae bacterium]|nr:FMN-binding protein [Lachnospiraceae bacterium]